MKYIKILIITIVLIFILWLILQFASSQLGFYNPPMNIPPLEP